MHYAEIERKREAEDPRPIPDASWTIMFKTLLGKKDKIIWGTEANPVAVEDIAAEVTARRTGSVVSVEQAKEAATEIAKEKVGALDEQGAPTLVTQEEREKLYRALRVASWQAVFYLITTDILGFA